MEQPLKATLSRRTFLAGSAVAAAAAGLTLAGCGGGGETTDTPSTDAGTDAGAAAQGGTLTGAMAYTSTNVNPIGNSSALMLAATWHVFEGLYDLDLHTYKTYNALAAGKPTKVLDTEYEVALRDGAKFSDGTDVTTADVVNAFEKNMADATYGAFLEFIDTVSAKDDKTVSFTLKYPFDSLLKGRLSVVKVFPASLTEDDLKTKPIGSGPWVYDTINGDDGGSIEFVPNTNYQRQVRRYGRQDALGHPARRHLPHHRAAGGHGPGYGERARRQRRTAHGRRRVRRLHPGLQPAVLHVQHAQEAVRR